MVADSLADSARGKRSPLTPLPSPKFGGGGWEQVRFAGWGPEESGRTICMPGGARQGKASFAMIAGAGPSQGGELGEADL